MRKIANSLREYLLRPLGGGNSAAEKTLMLVGSQAAKEVRRLQKVRDFAAVEFKVYSQWGEDGILDWLVEQLPQCPKSFVEFGVEDYSEANTRFLMMNRNFRGLVIDASLENVSKIRKTELAWRYDLTALCAFIDVGNINDMIRSFSKTAQLGVLSIDIDGNDYWIWKAIDAVRTWIVICEYNAVFGDIYPLTIPYAPDFSRARAHYSSLYYGASIQALKLLAPPCQHS